MKTVSLALAKQLAQNGYPQTESTFYYQGFEKELINEKGYMLSYKDNLYGAKEVKNVAAPTADEILDLLPPFIMQLGIMYDLIIMKEGGWMISYDRSIKLQPGEEGSNDLAAELDNSLADAVAKMYLYLKDHNMLDTKI